MEATRMNPQYDVLIVGGGPAGSTAATLLAKAGRRVLVVERERFPRFHIGESLLPNSMGTFERLGVKEKLDAICMPKIGAEFATACGHSQQFEFKNGFRAQFPAGYQVGRAAFDKVLLDHARESGAEVLEETAAEKFEETPEGLRVGIRHEGDFRFVECKFLLDCSGRHSVLGNYFDLKKGYPGLKKFSVYAHFEGVERDPKLTRLVRGKGFWFWTIPISETVTSIGLVMDSSDFQQRKQSPEAVLENALREQPMIWNRMGAAKRIGKVHSTGDYSYRNSKLTGNRWLMAGDAAGFIDPIFSTGVFLAVMSGEKAADTLDLVLEHGGRRREAFKRYEKSIQRTMKMYLRFVKGWYTQSFAEVFASPTKHFQLTAAVNAVLSGNVSESFSIRWRMELFYFVVFLQRFIPIVPKLSLKPSANATKVDKEQALTQ